MANVKINVVHPKVYGTDGKVMELGEQSVDSKLAERLISRGAAEKPGKAKPKAKSGDKELDAANAKITELEGEVATLTEANAEIETLTDKVAELTEANAELSKPAEESDDK